MNTARTDTILRFGAFELDARANELRKKGLKIKLQEQPFKILTMLLESPGEIVTREEIRNQLWPTDTFVDFDHGLNTAINRLRMALGDAADNPIFIETLPRRGYRFIGQLSVSTRAADQRVHAGGEKIRLAVLPLNDYSDGYKPDYFSDGLTEEMITQLGSMNPRKLGVIARTTVTRYRNTDKSIDEIGRELMVDYILEGSVRRVGERVRISAQLIHASDQTHVWAASYERPLSDVLMLQDEVSRQIVREIRIALTPEEVAHLSRERRVDPEAFEACLRGRFHWSNLSGDGWKQARSCYERAVARDSQFAPAYSGLVECYTKFGQFNLIPPREAFELAREAALKAVALDPTLAEAHASLAMIRCLYEWNWEDAERGFRRAIDLNPQIAVTHAWYSWYLLATGRREEAQHEAEVALSLEPYGNLTNIIMGWNFYASRDYGQAGTYCRKALELHPSSFLAHFISGVASLAEFHFDEAIRSIEVAARLVESDYAAGFLGVAYAMSGRHEELKGLYTRLVEKSRHAYVPAFVFATLALAMGDIDQMYGWFDKAFDERDSSLILLNCTPDFDPLRMDPRFQSLMSRLNLPGPTDARA